MAARYLGCEHGTKAAKKSGTAIQSSIAPSLCRRSCMRRSCDQEGELGDGGVLTEIRERLLQYNSYFA
jgi:hypothetical protein